VAGVDYGEAFAMVKLVLASMVAAVALLAFEAGAANAAPTPPVCGQEAPQSNSQTIDNDVSILIQPTEEDLSKEAGC
jgi:hypothetical protein